MVDVIMDQSLLRIQDRALDGLQLLSDLQTWTTFFDHGDDHPQVAVGPLQTSNNLRVGTVHIAFSYPGRRIDHILAGGCQNSLDISISQSYPGSIAPAIAWRKRSKLKSTSDGQYSRW